MRFLTCRVLVGYLRGRMFDQPRECGSHPILEDVDSRPLLQHFLALQRADVVEVDVHGQPGIAEDEQVQGRAALQDPSSLERGVRVQGVQEMHQA